MAEPFSTALGLGFKAVSAIQGAQAAKDAAVARNAALAETMRSNRKREEIADLNYMLAQGRDDDMREERAYLREREVFDRRTKSQERDFELKELAELKAMLAAERKEELERSVFEDQKENERRAFELAQLLGNQDLKGQERSDAMEAFERSQEIASDEALEDRLERAREKAALEAERDFARIEYTINRDQKMAERAEESQLRLASIARIDELGQVLGDVSSQFLPVDDMQAMLPQFTESDFRDEEARRTEQLFSDIDRARTGERSAMRAEDIARGVDVSTPAAARQDELTRKFADLYGKARRQARDESLQYITGRQAVGSTSLSDRLGLRRDLLSQAGMPQVAQLEALSRLQALPTAATNDWAGLPSVYEPRALLSAGDYRDPLSVATTSAIHDPDKQLSRGYAARNVPRSATTERGFGIDSSIFAPAGLNLSSGDALRTQGDAGYASTGLWATKMYEGADKQYKGTSKAYGDALKDLIETGGGVLDKWWASRKKDEDD